MRYHAFLAFQPQRFHSATGSSATKNMLGSKGRRRQDLGNRAATAPVSRFPALLTLSRPQAHHSSRLITSSILEGVGATKQASPRSGACENGLPRLRFSSPGPLSLRCAYCSSSDTVWNAHKAQSEAHDRQFSRDSRARPRQSSVQGTKHMGLVNILAATSFTIFDAASATQDTLGKGTAVRTSNTSSVVPVRHGPQGVGSVRTGIRLRASALGSDFGDGPCPYSPRVGLGHKHKHCVTSRAMQHHARDRPGPAVTADSRTASSAVQSTLCLSKCCCVQGSSSGLRQTYHIQPMLDARVATAVTYSLGYLTTRLRLPHTFTPVHTGVGPLNLPGLSNTPPVHLSTVFI